MVFDVEKSRQRSESRSLRPFDKLRTGAGRDDEIKVIPN